MNWPAGTGDLGNDGVANQMALTNGGIGYVELAYAIANGLPYAQMQKPRRQLCGAPGPQAYPIARTTWLLVTANQADATARRSLAQFAWWTLHDGQAYSVHLN